ncbi:MAG: hypothetical protein AAFR31_00850 [Cyanobacteria bacterium J06627_8]
MTSISVQAKAVGDRQDLKISVSGEVLLHHQKGDRPSQLSVAHK